MTKRCGEKVMDEVTVTLRRRVAGKGSCTNERGVKETIQENEKKYI